jgi:hypothetical protein
MISAAASNCSAVAKPSNAAKLSNIEWQENMAVIRLFIHIVDVSHDENRD